MKSRGEFVTKPEKSQSLFQRLQALDPERDVVFTAMERLQSDQEIQEFFQQYVDWLKERVQENPEEIARHNIGYITVYYGRETTDRWTRALPGISHPVFSKDIPWLETEKK